jgi:hypothetical protein
MQRLAASTPKLGGATASPLRGVAGLRHRSELKPGLRIDGQDAVVAWRAARPALRPASFHVIFHKSDHLCPTVPHSTARFLMFWFFVAVQAMAPFIHAHAGAVQLGHTDFLHVHQGAHGDAAWHVTAQDEHGAEIEVAQGMPLRNDMSPTAVPAPLAASPALPRASEAACPGAGSPAPPPLCRVRTDHAFPYALAPPAA